MKKTDIVMNRNLLSLSSVHFLFDGNYQYLNKGMKLINWDYGYWLML